MGRDAKSSENETITSCFVEKQTKNRNAGHGTFLAKTDEHSARKWNIAINNAVKSSAAWKMRDNTRVVPSCGAAGCFVLLNRSSE